MPQSVQQIQIPTKGLKFPISPELLPPLNTPDCLNVHEVNGEIWSRPGWKSFAPSDAELKLYLYYDANDDGHMHLREGTNDNIKLSQSFTTSAVSRTADTIKLKLKKNGTIATGKKVWITVETDSTGPSGTPITNGTSATLEANDLSGTAGWVTFTFSTPLSLSTSTKYWIVLQGDYALSATNNIEWEIDTSSSPYTDGAAYVYDSSWAATGANQDFLFKVYRDTTLIMLVDTFYLTTGSSYLVLCTLDRVFYFVTASKTWKDVTGYLAALMFTGTADDPFCSETSPADNLFLITNYVNPIKKWAGSSNMLADLGGSPPRAKYMKMYKGYLHLAYVYDDGADRPYRERWNDTGAIETWTGGASGYHDFLEGIDFLCGLVVMSDYLVALKERSLYLGYGVNNTDRFKFDQRVNGVGPMLELLVAELGKRILFVGWDDIYAWDGGEPTSIAGEDIKREFFEQTNPEQILRSFSLVMEEVSEWHIFVPSGNDEYPTTEWIYNYDKAEWFKYRRPYPICASGWYTDDTTLTIDDLQGTIDQQLWRIKDRHVKGFNSINLLGTSEGELKQVDYGVGEDDGEAVESYIDTKDFIFIDDKGDRIAGRVNELSVVMKGSAADLYYSDDGGDSFHLIDSIVPTNKPQVLGFRKTVEKIRFRVYKNAIGANFQWKAMSFKVRPGGRLP